MISGKWFADMHTHILPGMDDGSASVDESIALVSELSRQGITTVAATPHFYADRENPRQFLERRQNAIALLKECTDGNVTVLPGAEVCYYQGISQTEKLPELTIGGTNLLLLEMPFDNWNPSVINEVYSIQRDRKLNVVIAHIDRYLSKKNIDYIEDMLCFGILFQCNASAFLERKQRKEVLNMLKNREIHFIASDCHNMTVRPPRLCEAYKVIEDRLGHEAIKWLCENEKSIFGR